MYVYLKYNGVVKRIPNVTLHECFKPKVGEIVEERIDPGLWFKVLVLDSLFVDCDTKGVYWSNPTSNIADDTEKASKTAYDGPQTLNKADKLRKMPLCGDNTHEDNIYTQNTTDGPRQMTLTADDIHGLPSFDINVEKVLSFFKDNDRLFETGDCYEYAPAIFELFDIASAIFNNYSLQLFDIEGNTATYINLLKLLHVFILPRVKFKKKDIDHIKTVLDIVKHQCQSIDDKIQEKYVLKQNSEDSLHRQRQLFLKRGDFTSSRYVASLDDEFLTILLQHLEKDIQRLNENLVEIEREITPLRNSNSQQDVKLLAETRKQRTGVYDSLEVSITAREEIKNGISRDHVHTKQIRSPPTNQSERKHQLYVGIYKESLGINTEIDALVDVKLKITSVRNAITHTLNEIEKDNESYGYNTQKGPLGNLNDEYDPSNKPPEWTTLPEKVFTKLQETELREYFDSTCDKVRNKCQHLLGEANLFSPNNADPSITRSYSNYSTISIAPSKKESEELCREITSHIAAIAVKLALEISGLPEISQQFHSKVYICYEEYLSAEVMPTLSDLYEEIYREQCLHLFDWLSNTCFTEKQKPDIKKFVPRAVSSGFVSSIECSVSEEDGAYLRMDFISTRKASNRIVDNRQTEDLSLGEIYERANALEDSFSESFEGVLGVVPVNTVPEAAPSPHTNFEQSIRECLSIYETMLIPTQPSASIDKNSIPKGMRHCERKPQETNTNEDEDTEELDNDSENGTLSGSVRSDETVVEYLEVVEGRDDKTSLLTDDLDFPAVESVLEGFNDVLKEENKAYSLFRKLFLMSRALQHVESHIKKVRILNGKDGLVCADDLIEFMLRLLPKLDQQQFTKLYAHVNLLLHLSPSFTEGNASDYALVTLNAAYEYLFQQQVAQRR